MAGLNRSYVASLPGGTATTTVQITKKGTLKSINLSMVQAAAGAVEISRSSTSQIGTGQPTSDVICRVRISATAGNSQHRFDIENSMPLNILDNVYIHQTGTGNVGEVTLQ